MIVLTPIISVITILIYFLLSMFMPVLGYLVPYYKIKKVNIYNYKYRLSINLVVALILYILNIKILLAYLIYPLLTEFLFYLTQKFVFKFKIKTFDRIVIMSLISTILIFLIVYFNQEYIEKLFNEAFNISSLKLNIDIKEMYSSFLYLKKNILSATFSYIFIGNIFLFLALTPSTYEKWKISCYWLVPFMIIIILNKVLHIEFNHYFETNILDIIKYIYTWYGVKIIYQLLGKFGIKYSILKHLFSIFLGLFYPIPIFILGALASFNIVEIETIKI